MGSAGRLLVLIATLACRCTAEDLCDSQCDQPERPVCAQSSEDEAFALFPDLCVLECTNCRLRAAGVGVDYTQLNDSYECENEAVIIRECPEEIKADDDGKLLEDIGMLELDPDNYEGGDDEDEPSFADDGLPIGLMPSFPGGLLGRLLDSAMSMPAPPEKHESSLTIVDADVKVSVHININPTPRPGPPPPPPPRMPVLLSREEVLAPPPERLQYWIPEEGVYSSGTRGLRAEVAFVTAAIGLVATALHL